MADYFPGEIHIGGPIPRRLLKRLIAAIVAEGLSLTNYGDPAATPSTLQKALEAGEIVHLYDDQATYGQFEGLENFLARHRIHFNRHSDSRYEFSAENVYCRGGKRPIVLFATEEGCPLLSCDEVTAILDNASLDDTAKLRAIRRKAAPPEMRPLEPVRLVSGSEQKGDRRRCPR
jgi:hypothetical protein